MEKQRDAEPLLDPDTKGAEGEKFDLKGEPFTGFEVSIWIADPTLVPRYQPVIKKISDAVRDMTGSVCHECVQVKLRW